MKTDELSTPFQTRDKLSNSLAESPAAILALPRYKCLRTLSSLNPPITLALTCTKTCTKMIKTD